MTETIARHQHKPDKKALGVLCFVLSVDKMNHPHTPVSSKEKEGEDPDAAADVGDLRQNPTATTEGESPDSKNIDDR